MINIVNSEINTIIKFFGGFTESVVKILSKKFDADVFDKIDFLTLSASNVSSIDELKGNNALYKFNYHLETVSCGFLVLIPEEFVAIVSGNAQNVYTGSLSEIEVNDSLDLFKYILEGIGITFKRLYNKELAIFSESEVILKNTLEYNKLLNNSDFDFFVSYNLKLGKDKEFPIIVLVNAYDIKQLLININVLKEAIIPNISRIMQREMDGFADISKIADIKIDIFAELGRSKISIKQVLGLVGGSIVELDTYENSDIKVFANGLEVAKAQVVVIDEHFGIKITEIVSPEERYKDK